MAKEAKYRPYLTLEQLNYLYFLLSNPPQDVTKIDTHIELRQNFKLLQFKANEGLTNPSYMSNPKVDLETSIGITLEEKRLAAWEKYSTADNTAKLADLTDQEIAYAEVYMYENNLMRTDEEVYYEQHGTLIGYENSPTDMHT
jgi:hypothetical protein